ncbi:MAG TPA: DUF6584 family protein [Natronosporangium sp.]
MAKPYVLDRIAADLARGCTHPAIQRLSSLVAAYPHDLDLRRRLAAVHRRVGNRIQAGRWDYLTIGADSRDTVAFERAFPSAVARLREVRWPMAASHAATEYARRRLAKLMAGADAERPRVRSAARPGRRVRLIDRLTGRVLAAIRPFSPSVGPGTVLAVAIGMVLATPLAVIGLVTVVEWVV